MPGVETAAVDAAPEFHAAGEPPIFDEVAESAFLADARERGELISAPVPPVLATEREEGDPKGLPPLEELLKRIPAGVRESLDDLFRARFVTVRRIPKRSLKPDRVADGG